MRKLRFLDPGPPLVAFITATLVLWGAALIAGVPIFDPASWSRWDSHLYLQMARSGLQLTRCAKQFPRSWRCGNSGWWPGYPLLLTPLFKLGLPQVGTAMVVAWLFDFGLLLIVWRYYLRDIGSPLRYVALAFVAAAPGGVYMRAIFPLSTAAFFIVGCLLLLQRRHWAWASLACACAGFCYITANLLVPVVFAWVLWESRGEPMPARLLRAVRTAAVGALGFAIALLTALIETGHWNAYFIVQRNYHHGLHLPFANLWFLIHGFLIGTKGGLGVQAAIGTLVAVLVLVVLVDVTVRVIRGTADTTDVLVAVLLVLLWLVPLTQNRLSWYRGDTLFVPAALLLPRLPRGVAVLLTAASVALLPALAYYFFAGVLS